MTGGDGILAQALRPYFPLADYFSKEEMDVTNPSHVRAGFQAVKPELVIHCGAITKHDAEPMAYVMGNILGTCNVVAQSKKLGARCVYPSTDYLGARLESDPIRPVNPYAASKFAAEATFGALGNSLVIRGSWYSRFEPLIAATDAFTSKLPVAKAAYYIALLAVSSHTGVVNIGGPRRSYYDIALEFNEQVKPVSRHQINVGYPIPADCSLDTSKLNRWLAAA